MTFRLIILIFLLYTSGCSSQPLQNRHEEENKLQSISLYDTTYKTIHVFVALCDNKYQGIVPVPAKIGNGQDPDNNLYWGCAFGVRSFFKNSKEWNLVSARKLHTNKLERLVFKHATKNFYLVADAYDGQYIKNCVEDFLYSASGQLKDTVETSNSVIGICGNASLVCYVGHDGLMDFELDKTFENADGKSRDCIILACVSRSYFAPHLSSAKAYPLVWTTGLMCPEAYTLHDALSGYMNNESKENIKDRAAAAYSKYQKCSSKAAKNLLVTGW